MNHVLFQVACDPETYALCQESDLVPAESLEVAKSLLAFGALIPEPISCPKCALLLFEAEWELRRS